MRSVLGAPAESLGAGEVGLIFGLGDVAIGQVIGDAALLPAVRERGGIVEGKLEVADVGEVIGSVHRDADILAHLRHIGKVKYCPTQNYKEKCISV